MSSAAATNCQNVSYLIQIKGSAMLSSELVSWFMELVFPQLYSHMDHSIIKASRLFFQSLF